MTTDVMIVNGSDIIVTTTEVPVVIEKITEGPQGPAGSQGGALATVHQSSEWNATNPTMALGEIGIESDTRKMKIGDGATPWNGLDYFLDVPSSIANADLTGIQEGSILIYNGTTQKFTVTSLLNQQSIDAGEF